MIEHQYNQLLKEIRDISSHVGDIDNSLARDRELLGDVNVRLSGVETQVEELRKSSARQANNVQNKVAEAVLPVMEQAESLEKQIKNKKTMVIREKVGLLKFFARYFQK